jgi:hypothetical protein
MAWHSKGLIVSLTDTLALAICIRYMRRARKPFLSWICCCTSSAAYLAVCGALFTPAIFNVFTLLKATLYFRACYLVAVRRLGCLVTGLLCHDREWLRYDPKQDAGQLQAAGLIGHRNYAGMLVNMAVPVLLVAGMQLKLKALPLMAVVLCGVAAAIGGSRAVIVFFGITVFMTLVLVLCTKPSRQAGTVFALCLLGSLVITPLAMDTLSDRFAQTGSSFETGKDDERLALEQASKMMNADHPFGVGANQWAVTANTKGYSSAAGVAWQTSAGSATVHNSYALVRTEGGQVALAGMLVLLGSALFSGLLYLFRRRVNPARLFAVPVVVTTSVLIVHLNYEWGFVSMGTLYMFAFNTALAAYIGECSRRAKAVSRQSAPVPMPAIDTGPRPEKVSLM